MKDTLLRILQLKYFCPFFFFGFLLLFSLSYIRLYQDEAHIKVTQRLKEHSRNKHLRMAILEGNWNEVEKLCKHSHFRNRQAFLYAIYKQQYLEHIEYHDTHKAFSILNKKLKPLERYATNPKEFRDLCYLLTCRSVQDAASFRNWDGAKNSRLSLVDQFETLLDVEQKRTAPVPIPPKRLLHLLRQAVAYQMEFSRYHPKVAPEIATLLEDYKPFVLPNTLKSSFEGHMANVKCVEFVGEEGLSLASGSSDNTVRIWNLETAECLQILKGHSSRIWDLSSSQTGVLLSSASADGTVKLWDLTRTAVAACRTLVGDARGGDVYTVKFHPGDNYVVTGGYDKKVKLFDVRTGQEIKRFVGHEASVSRAIFNPHGNLIITGSKDNTIKFWDIMSGMCIKTYSSHLGEVTSVQTNLSGGLLLSGSKDNSNRLWDVRTARPICRYKGHQNTSKNFVRSNFGPNEKLIIGGSEDGLVYIWDIETGNLLQRLRGHRGIVYTAVWNSQQSLLASCADDGTLKTWWYDEEQPLSDNETRTQTQ